MSHENENELADYLQQFHDSIVSCLVELDDSIRFLRTNHSVDCSVHISSSYNEFIENKWDSLVDISNSIWCLCLELDYILKK